MTAFRPALRLRIAMAIVGAGALLASSVAAVSAATPNFKNVAPPVITGTAKAGEVLVASPGEWNRRPDSIVYRWKAEGRTLASSVQPEFVIPGSAVGKRVTVTAAGVYDGHGVDAVSAPTDVVASSSYQLVKPTGLYLYAARVGSSYTTYPATWTGGIGTRSYQLLADGVPVAGATRASGYITPELLGKRLSMRETISSEGYASASSTTAESAPIAAATLEVRRHPAVVGYPVVGEQLSVARPPEFESSGSAPVSVGQVYQWLADGAPIDGATGQTLLLTSGLQGKAITLRITAAAPGHDTVTVTSTTWPATPVVAAGTVPVTPGMAEVVGIPQVGALLKAYTSGWEPYPVANSYQWLVDGVEVAGATKETFVPSSAHEGKQVSVRITGTRARLLPASVTSAPSAAVEGSTPFGAPQNLASTGSTPESIDINWTKVDGAVKYRIYYGIGSGKRTKVEVTNTTVATLKKLKPDTRYSVDVAALKADGTKSAYSPRVTMSTSDLDSPDDLELLARTPTSLTYGWEKVPGAVKYRLYTQLQSGGKVTKLEVGDVATATIKGLKPGTDYHVQIDAVLPSGLASSKTVQYRAHTPSLEPPTNLRVVSTTSTSITLAWDKVAGIPKYRLYHGIGTGKRTKVEVGDVDTVTISKLKPGTTYTIDIASLLSDGTTRSGYSPRLPVTTD